MIGRNSQQDIGKPMEANMRFLRTVATTLALSLGALTFAAPASADADDAVIAGAAGFAVGTFFGAATRPYYGGRAYARAYHRPGAYYRRAPFHAYRALRPRWYATCRGQRSSSSFNKGNFVGYSGTARFCY
jgi:phosphate-selective porin